jgi:hypothetical protein
MLTCRPTALARAGWRVAPLAVGIGVALAGCGGSSGNGVASKSADEILAASKAAADGASSVHVSSKTSLGATSLTFNLDLTSAGGRVHLTLGPLTYELIRVGNTLYLKGNPVFNQSLRTTTGLRAPHGKWLETQVNSAQLAQLAAITDRTGELGLLLRPQGAIGKGITATVNGHKAIELKETGQLSSSALYVATTGKPYPVALVKSGRETGATTFSGWNEPVSLTAPPNAIASSRLKREGH